ncbi:DNA alkylation repair protein [Aquimarina sp. MMG016]|uniref:DNA alkylation repair protein n=1 Tax=Aquimarina sp. MMG016 TaxID=2822690 RepID=UPI001B39EC2F|nr:DNA alkylation repair protein [Aquimarina sp. MMG016]MBQ4819240.1 DNA alkylation repair protein [Aquimarina sp. MMG016]
MADPLKNVYNTRFFEQFTTILKKVYPQVNIEKFMSDIYCNDWEDKELKQRMYHISQVMYKYLPQDYETATNLIIRMVNLLKTKEESTSFEFMFLPDFVEKYGLENYSTSIKVMEEITQFTSCEFAVRPFIIKYPEQMVQQLVIWSTHKNSMVRRLASEGSRPRLPWAIGLPKFKKDPTSIIPILENLRNDPSEMVRRSVANNLNDISKDNPEVVINLAKKWKSDSKETHWMIKHACRTLLKEGNSEVLGLFGFGSVEHIKIKSFKIHTPKVKIGEYLKFSFTLLNKNKEASNIRLEYGIYYQKANGTLSRKVFKISERTYNKQTITKINRRQPFKIITTRKLYKGKHQLSLIINGKEFQKLDFELI